MYYRVAIQRGQSPTWQWKSTVLSSLESLFHLLRLYRPLAPDHLRVFSSCSREGLDEQLMGENNGVGSYSVTAAQFLQERLISSPSMTSERSADETREHQELVAVGITTRPASNESSMPVPTLETKSMNPLERRRIEVERGAGGDHDLAYTFALPASRPQVLAWMKLLAKVRTGELQP